MKNKSGKSDRLRQTEAVARLQRALAEKRGDDALHILSRLRIDSLPPPGQEVAAQALVLRALHNHAAGGQVNAAIADLSLASRYLPSNHGVQFHLGLAYLKARLYAKGLRALRAAVERQPQNVRYLHHAAWAAVVMNHPESESWLARLEAAGGDASRLRGVIASSEAPAPQEASDLMSDGLAQISRGNRELQSGNAAAALECFEAARSLGIDRPEISACIFQLRARQLHQKLHAGETAGVEADLDRLKGAGVEFKDRCCPYSAFIKAAQASEAAGAGKWAEAISLWKEAAAFQPAQPMGIAVLHNIALACEQSGDFERAAVYWRRWIEAQQSSLDPELAAEAHRRLARCQERAEKHERAAGVYRSLLRANPGDLQARQDLADYCLEEEQWSEAVQHLEFLQKNTRETSARWTQIGMACREMGKDQKAQQAWRRALDVDPENRAAQDQIFEWLSAHLNRMSEKQYAASGLRLIQDTIAIAPKSPRMQLLLAEYFANMRDWKRGVRVLEDALAVNPADPQLLAGGLSLCLQHGSAKQVKEFSERTLALAGNRAMLLVATGMALLHHGKGKVADSHFRAAVAASRDAAPAAEIANSLLRAGCYDKAERYGLIALDRNPQNGENLGMMAEIMFRLGRNDEARAFLEAGRKNAVGNELLLETLEFLEEDFA